VSIIWVDLGKQNGGCTKHTCFRSDGENKPMETCMSKSLWRKIINITKNVVSSSVEDSQQLQTWHRCNRKPGFMSYIRILRFEYLWILLPTRNTCTYRQRSINYHSRFLSPARNRSPNHGSSSPNSGHCTDVQMK
jgi:hypothetical protein